MQKIAFFELEDWEKRYLKKKLEKKFELVFFKDPIKDDVPEKAKDADIIGIFIYSHITKDILTEFSNLKYITTFSTGYDHIDLEECKKKNIKVSNVPSYGEVAVAEQTFALLLAVSRRIIESHERVKEGFFSPEGLTGFDLSGKTMGVVGVGTIGQHVIKIAKGFGMDVLGYKRSPDAELEKKLGFKIVDMDTLLKESDVITLHVPYTKETHHMIGEKEFDKMKKGSVIINTARGGIIDTQALIRALYDKKIGGAGLDVCEGEPLLQEEKELMSRSFNKEELLSVVQNHMLLNFNNVVISPHNAFNTHEALKIIIDTSKENIERFVEGNAQNLVSLD